MTTNGDDPSPAPHDAVDHILRYKQEDFHDPPYQCDLVMQGGAASGVVYPAAILQIATQYRLRSIGGTSAGAIAAAAAAAAEYGREREQGGFLGLQDLQAELCNDHFVRNLFQPSRATRPLLETLLDMIQKHDPANKTKSGESASAKQQTRWSKVRFIGWLTSLLFRHTTLVFICGGIIGVVLPLVFMSLVGGSVTAGLLILCLVFGWLGGLVGSVGYLLRIMLVHVSNKDTHLFGICTGSAPQDATPSGLALTDWLSARINRMAGLPEDGEPLTFANLKNKKVQGHSRFPLGS